MTNCLFIALVVVSFFFVVKAQEETLGDPLAKIGKISSSESASWFVKPAAAKRVFYVHPTDHQLGRDGTVGKPFKLSDLLDPGIAEAGDVFFLLEGIYRGHFEFTYAGSETEPIIIRAFPGHQARIEGKISVKADNVWIWGLEITDKYNTVPLGAGINMEANGVKVIHCYIHDIHSGSGVFSPHAYSGHLVYGTTIMRVGLERLADELVQPAHLIHAANHYDETGFKYLVSNILMNQEMVCAECSNIYGFAEPEVSEWDELRANGFGIISNVLSQGRAEIGGDGPPSDRLLIDGNYFFETEVNLGDDAPTSGQVSNNFGGWSSLNTLCLWGAGEQAYPDFAPNRYTGNSFYNPWKAGSDVADRHVLRIRTARYSTAGPQPAVEEQLSRIADSTVFSGNTYGPPSAYFRLDAGGLLLQETDFETYRNRSAEVGPALDQDSRMDNMTTDSSQPSTFAWRSVYDDQFGFLAVFNWAEELKVFADISGLRLSEGDRVELVDPSNPFEEPALVGNFAGQQWPIDFSKFDLRPVFVDTNNQEEIAADNLVKDVSDRARAASGQRFSVWLLRINWALTADEVQQNLQEPESTKATGSSKNSSSSMSVNFVMLLLIIVFMI